MKWVCQVCGYVHDGPEPPAICPVCKAPRERFEQFSGERQWADEHKIGIAKGVDERIVTGLRKEYTGECTEVAMYLAMARAADREGCPEVATPLQRIAMEEAAHAARLAEILGEVLSESTQRNLKMRVDAEQGSSQAKRELATLAKELGLDAIHDSLHEMCKDESRHGKVLDGLLKRYYEK